jgi:hypothetical protein
MHTPKVVIDAFVGEQETNLRKNNVQEGVSIISEEKSTGGHVVCPVVLAKKEKHPPTRYSF